VSAGRELAVLVACAIAYFVGTGEVPFYTRGEPREGLVVREMLRTGDWLVPARPDDEPTRKPPLYYWAAAPVLAALPDAPERALRLPSAVLATAAVLATWATARAAWGPASALPAALVLATAFEWVRAATSARVDMTLAAMLACAFAGFVLALARGSGWTVLAAAGAALGTLAKGPVALMLPALAFAVFALGRREVAAIRRLRAPTVLAAAAVVAAVWYALAYHRLGAELLGVVARENWLRFLGADDADASHRHGPLYLVGLGLVGFLPWTPLLPLGLAFAARRPRTAPTAFAAAWAVAVFAFFAVAAAKRSVYLLPATPALACLVGAAVTAAPEEGPLVGLTRKLALLYAPGLALVALLLAALAAGLDPSPLTDRLLRPSDAIGARTLVSAARAAAPALAAVALATLAAAVLAGRAARAAAWRRVVFVVSVTMVLWTATFNVLIHPAIARARTLKSFLAHVATVAPVDRPLYARFPPDPGLRFYAPRHLRPWPTPDPPPRHVLLWEDDWSRLETPSRLRVIAKSDAVQGRRGRLLLVAD
jgi:4-amino-4-deoxy-L-arabinose transferase-like glycosyltransferase